MAEEDIRKIHIEDGDDSEENVNEGTEADAAEERLKRHLKGLRQRPAMRPEKQIKQRLTLRRLRNRSLSAI